VSGRAAALIDCGNAKFPVLEPEPTSICPLLFELSEHPKAKIRIIGKKIAARLFAIVYFRLITMPN
jgi:hypothetical protein